MNQLEKDIAHVLTCWLDYNRLNYKWKVDSVSVRPGTAGWSTDLSIILKASGPNPYDPEDEFELFTKYYECSRPDISHQQQDEIKYISDVAFPIIFYETLRLIEQTTRILDTLGDK